MPSLLIAVDPGHGGSDPGAVSQSGQRESDLNLSLARHFVDAAWADDFFDVVVTREGDTHIPLDARAELVNKAEANAVVSLHCNAFDDSTVRGFEVWTTPGETPADGLASLVYGAMRLGCPYPGRSDFDDGDPDKEANFYILRHTRAPAILIEFGFITNWEDLAFLGVDRNRRFIATMVERAVAGWLDRGSE